MIRIEGTKELIRGKRFIRVNKVSALPMEKVPAEYMDCPCSLEYQDGGMLRIHLESRASKKDLERTTFSYSLNTTTTFDLIQGRTYPVKDFGHFKYLAEKAGENLKEINKKLKAHNKNWLKSRKICIKI